jgi:hypothetical protein
LLREETHEPQAKHRSGGRSQHAIIPSERPARMGRDQAGTS